jgi:hypothetical protein
VLGTSQAQSDLDQSDLDQSECNAMYAGLEPAEDKGAGGDRGVALEQIVEVDRR